MINNSESLIMINTRSIKKFGFENKLQDMLQLRFSYS